VTWVRAQRIGFDGWVLDPESGDLERAGSRIRLQEQPLQVLMELIAAGGGLVTREQLIAKLWPRGVVDFDTGLNTVIRKLRVALEDTADTPRYIETIPRRGYRFIGTLDAPPEVPVPVASAPQPLSLSVPEPAVPDEIRPVKDTAGTGKPDLPWHGVLRRLPWRTLVGVAAVGVLTLLVVWHRFRNIDVIRLQQSVVVTTPTAPLVNPPSHLIAVLPFADMSEKQDQDYFADGMAEEILNHLVKVPGLRVIGRTSSFQFKGKTDDLRRIGATLGATYIVEGSVRRSGDHVRITAHLIDVRTGAHRWSETYDRDIPDVLRVQSDIAGAICSHLQLEVTGDPELQNRLTVRSREAYEFYLRGLHSKNRFDEGGLEEAVADLKRALELDPSFVRAAEELATVKLDLVDFGLVPAKSGFGEARNAVNDLLALDPHSATAHALLGDIHTWYDYDWEAAEREFGIAIRLAPSDTQLLRRMAEERLFKGDLHEAMRLDEASLAADPLHPVAYEMLGWTQLRLGQYAEAESSDRRVLELSPTFSYGHFELGTTLLLQGKLEESLAEMAKERLTHARIAGLAIASAALRRRSEADAHLARLEAEHAERAAYLIAEAHAVRGEKSQAFSWLDRAYAQRDSWLVSIKGDPLLRTLEGDARYKAFLRKMNLPE